jgi:aldehyde dehydrogenase (NAD+)
MPTPLDATLAALGVASPSPVAVGRRWLAGSGPTLDVRTPIDGSQLAAFPQATAADLKPLLAAATSAFKDWRMVPAPVRGEFVRRIGERLRQKKEQLAQVVSWEAGKITQEALGEVQEMIDICDFAVGLSRQLYGLTIASERPRHRLMEQWHPLGPVGVITAFNFPVAVWAWNAMLGLVCGDPIVWKPSHKTPLCALATHAVVINVLNEMPEIPDGVVSLIVGGTDVGEAVAAAAELPLVSATGSTRMGRAVGQAVAARLGRSLLELGGNNAMIVAPSADLELAVRSITFAAVGTCGQRCTTLRRLIVHKSIIKHLVASLKTTYAQLRIGNPLGAGTLVGPLIDEAAFDAMQKALDAARASGGTVFGGERIPRAGVYVNPAIVEIDPYSPIVQQETFAPILYVMPYKDLTEAIDIQNGVPQGLASAILTNDLREAEWFLSPAGSDCGIANVNIGTSGAEIGGAFGGEKETGGGRESGSDAWKAYMRRATNTVNYSRDLPLAQGIKFGV